ncbi:MAG TPA: hypothetical protein VHQ03_03945 [Candidatus Dormibacteraeota bacterium]|jgi:hypothetical protein|nr:hypothetical protein [Candidatus Dormibacteraeota bacterium]
MKAGLMLGAAVLLLASNACGSTQPAPRPLSPELQGWWDARFFGDPSEFSQGSFGKQSMFGTWRLKVAGNTVDLLNPDGGRPAAVGKVLPSSRIEFSPDPDCDGQTEVRSGVYSFSVSGDHLTFTEVQNSDSCLDRVTTLTAHPWIKGI